MGFSWRHLLFFCVCLGVISSSAYTATYAQTLTLTEQERQRIINLGSNTLNRMDATLFRLEHIADRIEKRAGKLEGEEYTWPKVYAVSDVGRARAMMADARKQLATMDTNLQGVAQSENPRLHWQKIKPIYNTIEERLAGAKLTLEEAVYEIEFPDTVDDTFPLGSSPRPATTSPATATSTNVTIATSTATTIVTTATSTP